MKKITLLAALLAVFSMNAQLFSDDFQDGDISDWTLLDEDGDGKNFFAFDPLQTGVDYHLSSQSFDYTTGSPLTPNNYAISPEIDVTGHGSLQLDYMVGAQAAGFSAETYTVYVSTGNTIADFMNTDPSVTVSFSENLDDDPDANGALVLRSFNVSTLDGATSVYVAFRHHDSTDQFAINFDDVVLDGVLAVGDNVLEGFKYFVSNNELNLSSNNSMENVSLYNILGQQVVSQKLSSNNETVNLSGLQSGVYIATVSIDGAVKSFKIVKN